MNFTVEILESTDQISKKILKAIAEEFNNRMQSKKARIEERIRNFTISFFKSTDTYDSLVNGELAANFGLPAANRRIMVDSIIDKIGDSIRIDIKPIKQFGKKFRGQTNINVLVNDFSDILSMAEAMVSTEDGSSLPWLEWLLLKGDVLIINEYDVRLIGGKGRSGLGIMVKDSASAWRVPPQYSGTIRDNWLTRTIKIYKDQYLQNISTILKQELE
jgi:hypothetical protein